MEGIITLDKQTRGGPRQAGQKACPPWRLSIVPYDCRVSFRGVRGHLPPLQNCLNETLYSNTWQVIYHIHMFLFSMFNIWSSMYSKYTAIRINHTFVVGTK